LSESLELTAGLSVSLNLKRDFKSNYNPFIPSRNYKNFIRLLHIFRPKFW